MVAGRGCSAVAVLAITVVTAGRRGCSATAVLVARALRVAMVVPVAVAGCSWATAAMVVPAGRRRGLVRSAVMVVLVAARAF